MISTLRIPWTQIPNLVDTNKIRLLILILYIGDIIIKYNEHNDLKELTLFYDEINVIKTDVLNVVVLYRPRKKMFEIHVTNNYDLQEDGVFFDIEKNKNAKILMNKDISITGEDENSINQLYGTINKIRRELFNPDRVVSKIEMSMYFR